MTTNWNQATINGVEYLVIDVAQLRIPLDFDPSSAMFIAVAAPTGGLGNFPTLVKGETGSTPTLSAVNYTVLEANDPTADTASWTETSPDTYTLNVTIHKGPTGASADTVLDVNDFTNVAAGKMIVVNSDVDGFELAIQKIGDRYIPSSISAVPAGNAAYTLCSVSIPAQPFDWRPEVSGQCVIVPSDTAGDSVIHLIARLNNELAGNEVGRGYNKGSTGFWSPVVLSPGPPPSASSTYDRVSAGNAATIYLRAERQSGSQTFTTSADTTRFCVWVRPI